jgi:pilus assembly protein CpaE
MDGGTAPAVAAPEESGRQNRLPLLAFIADSESEAVLREGLLEALPHGFEIRRGNVRTALVALGKMATPKALIIDITGEEHPLALLGDLAHVVEPDVQVMIVGEREDVAFYRQVTRMLGAAEYLYKPLMAEMVARHFGAQITHSSLGTSALGGRMVTITGARGGTGATTVAANLAWYLAVVARRHTVLLDADLVTGTAAMLLGAQAGPGLRSALESPARVDELFVERSASLVVDRLSLLAGEERLSEQPGCVPGAPGKLVEMMRRRFNFVVADVPFRPSTLNRELLDLTQQRVIVLTPTLGSVRDALRLLALPAGAAQARRAVLVLNRAGQPGGMTRKQVEEALQLTVDVAIPDLPRILGAAESLGDPAAAPRSGFRTGIVDLAREVSFVRVMEPVPKRRWWKRAK